MFDVKSKFNQKTEKLKIKNEVALCYIKAIFYMSNNTSAFRDTEKVKTLIEIFKEGSPKAIESAFEILGLEKTKLNMQKAETLCSLMNETYR